METTPPQEPPKRKNSTGAATVIIGLILMVGFISAMSMFLKHQLAPAVTHDNAKVMYLQFQAAINKDKIDVIDPKGAVALADQSLRQITNSPLLDGWGRPMVVTAKLNGKLCTLYCRSAGPDGVFDTADDVVDEMQFDLHPQH